MHCNRPQLGFKNQLQLKKYIFGFEEVGGIELELLSCLYCCQWPQLLRFPLTSSPAGHRDSKGNHQTYM